MRSCNVLSWRELYKETKTVRNAPPSKIFPGIILFKSVVYCEEKSEKIIQYCKEANLGESVVGVWRLVPYREGGMS